jgi:hypothetical protein
MTATPPSPRRREGGPVPYGAVRLGAAAAARLAAGAQAAREATRTGEAGGARRLTDRRFRPGPELTLPLLTMADLRRSPISGPPEEAPPMPPVPPGEGLCGEHE